MWTVYDKDDNPVLSADTFAIAKHEAEIKLGLYRWDWVYDSKIKCFENRKAGELKAYIPGISAKRP